METVELKYAVTQVQQAPAAHVTLTVTEVYSVTGSSAEPKIPIAETEQEKVMGRLMKKTGEMFGMGPNDLRTVMQQKLASVITLPMEGYEMLDRPTVGDILTVTLKKQEVIH